MTSLVASPFSIGRASLHASQAPSSQDRSSLWQLRQHFGSESTSGLHPYHFAVCTNSLACMIHRLHDSPLAFTLQPILVTRLFYEAAELRRTVESPDYIRQPSCSGRNSWITFLFVCLRSCDNIFRNGRNQTPSSKCRSRGSLTLSLTMSPDLFIKVQLRVSKVLLPFLMPRLTSMAMSRLGLICIIFHGTCFQM